MRFSPASMVMVWIWPGRPIGDRELFVAMERDRACLIETGESTSVDAWTSDPPAGRDEYRPRPLSEILHRLPDGVGLVVDPGRGRQELLVDPDRAALHHRSRAVPDPRLDVRLGLPVAVAVQDWGPEVQVAPIDPDRLAPPLRSALAESITAFSYWCTSHSGTLLLADVSAPAGMVDDLTARLRRARYPSVVQLATRTDPE